MKSQIRDALVIVRALNVIHKCKEIVTYVKKSGLNNRKVFYVRSFKQTLKLDGCLIWICWNPSLTHQLTLLLRVTPAPDLLTGNQWVMIISLICVTVRLMWVMSAYKRFIWVIVFGRWSYSRPCSMLLHRNLNLQKVLLLTLWLLAVLVLKSILNLSQKQMIWQGQMIKSLR